jgi:mannose-6-phosphate isomerase-like protein (cupin superfamily)
MTVISHDGLPVEAFDGGATYRTIIGDDDGSTPIRLGLQVSPPGYATPTHSHPYVEILTIVAGTGIGWLEGEEITLAAGMTVVLPAGQRHGFRVTGAAPLETYGIHLSPHRIVDLHQD